MINMVKQQAICCIIMKAIKKWAWNNIISKYWHDYIQCEIDDIDIDQLMTDRAELYAEARSEAHD